MKPSLERWIVFGNCIVGYIFDDKNFTPGQRVRTDPIRFIDLENFEAECLDGKYRLGEPGTKEEHEVELIGKPTTSEIPKIDTTIFLNPRG